MTQPAASWAQSPSAIGAANAGRIQPRIFNGVATFEFPFSGLLLGRDGEGSVWASRCSLTLIGPDAALTAAHCLCDSRGGLCQPGGPDAPRLDRLRVLLQNAGIFEIRSVTIPLGFDFPEQDYAVVRLARSVGGIAPARLATAVPAPGTSGQIVGFGTASSGEFTAGVKRVGTVQTGPCDNNLSDADFVCWTSNGGVTGADTCPGDSGAPLLVDEGLWGQVVAGVASGGFGVCDGEDLAFDTAVAPIGDAVVAAIADTPATASGGEVVARAGVLQGSLSAAAPDQVLTIEVPAGCSRLVVVGNAQETGQNDYALQVAWGEPPSEPSIACTSDLPGVFEACTVTAPRAGTWTVNYRHQAGPGGPFQLSATALLQGCSLDVDGNGRFDALTDGLLFARHLGGMSGTALVANALGDGSTRTQPRAIADYLDGPQCVNALDVDLDGSRLIETDGALVLRYLFGFSGEALTQAALAPGAIRTEPGDIGAALGDLMR